MDPQIGVPTLTHDELYALQNTSGFAFDPFYSRRASNHRDTGSVKLGLGTYKNPLECYNSPLVHTVVLRGLAPSGTYGYRVAGDGRNFTFTMPAVASGTAHELYPFTLGLTADLGQTAVSEANADALAALMDGAPADRRLLLLAGDLSYADGYYPRWDSFARMMEPVAARVPIMTVGGNHEYSIGEAWQSYNARYPMPHAPSGSASNQWWSADVGPVHLIGLCTYAATAPGSLQHAWLARDLSAVDRAATPWLVVMMHAPWYNTNTGHRAEAEQMRRHMEPLLCAWPRDRRATAARPPRNRHVAAR